MDPQFVDQVDGVLAVNCWVACSLTVTLEGETVTAKQGNVNAARQARTEMDRPWLNCGETARRDINPPYLGAQDAARGLCCGKEGLRQANLSAGHTHLPDDGGNLLRPISARCDFRHKARYGHALIFGRTSCSRQIVWGFGRVVGYSDITRFPRMLSPCPAVNSTWSLELVA